MGDQNGASRSSRPESWKNGRLPVDQVPQQDWREDSLGGGGGCSRASRGTGGMQAGSATLRHWRRRCDSSVTHARMGSIRLLPTCVLPFSRLSGTEGDPGDTVMLAQEVCGALLAGLQN